MRSQSWKRPSVGLMAVICGGVLVAGFLLVVKVRAGTEPSNCKNDVCFEFSCFKEGADCYRPGQTTCRNATNFWTSGSSGGTETQSDQTSGQKMQYCDKQCADKTYSEADNCSSELGEPEANKFDLCYCGSGDS